MTTCVSCLVKIATPWESKPRRRNALAEIPKERRQVIIVTHTANIAVLGDAEQIIVLKAQDDNGRIVSRGSIDHPDTRRYACDILEGSIEAFKRRAAIYGVS